MKDDDQCCQFLQLQITSKEDIKIQLKLNC